jgi:hypothetical protein
VYEPYGKALSLSREAAVRSALKAARVKVCELFGELF